MLAWLVFSTRIAPGVLDPQWTESAPITMAGGILPTPHHYAVAGWL